VLYLANPRKSFTPGRPEPPRKRIGIDGNLRHCDNAEIPERRLHKEWAHGQIATRKHQVNRFASHVALELLGQDADAAIR
jgi:hypothetical protein